MCLVSHASFDSHRQSQLIYLVCNFKHVFVYVEQLNVVVSWHRVVRLIACWPRNVVEVDVASVTELVLGDDWSMKWNVQTAGDGRCVRQHAWFVSRRQQQVEHVATDVCGSVDRLMQVVALWYAN